MKRFVVAGFVLVVLVEVIALAVPERSMTGWAAGGALAVLLISVRSALRDDPPDDQRTTASEDAAELLARWQSETEILISRADSTRSQWDRHLRPRLAREFAAASGQRLVGDQSAFQATGRMLFGEQLWQWVDPNNVASARDDGPGPGRAALAEILQRLEQL
ncbi:hypothetical protein KL953_20570 [Mycolicibacterium goodii]|uniref:hypothetical protein n=1 Tax=Mycolicibacterium goodii TaxID=134601 RepID=UPI00093CD0CE|nr:hypothetical protein [Mycolicibacterium goodii]MBU8811277.1 hypothetical protein [Mycolicibacterium goodii]OKH73450.1 hypothetical protein EB74_19660 [Mycobacterium sp. SWH-M5]PJK18707.1 hypothetical protein CSX11_29875 [Mycolicibacterium goodii]ULN45342.1 hypothetical protein MI170_18415 [Mycolicibacterium goodii]